MDDSPRRRPSPPAMLLAANLSWLFTEVPFLDRPRAAARAGFGAAEALFPYDTDAEAFRDALAEAGLPLVLINTPLPPTGERGFAAMPGRGDDFRRDFARAATYARRAGAARIHVMSGTASGPEARATLIANLRWASGEAPDLALSIEPLNRRDAPGYFLDDFREAARIVADTGLPNLGIQFDAYHAEVIHGDACTLWAETASHTSHVQVAGAPKRNEPDRGSLDLARFFSLIGRSGYDGTAAAEYRPDGATPDGLAWMETARRAWAEGRKETA